MMPSAVGLVGEAWQVAAGADIQPEQQNRGIERQRRDADSRDAVYRTIELSGDKNVGCKGDTEFENETGEQRESAFE